MHVDEEKGKYMLNVSIFNRKISRETVYMKDRSSEWKW